MKNIKIAALLTLCVVAGSLVGHGVSWFLFDRHVRHHVCTCETCKAIRQLEALELVDSVIHERIVISVNGVESQD